MSLTIRKILNIGFVLFLFLPLFIFTISPLKEVSLAEKRKLAPFPGNALQSLSLGEFSRQFESFWNDHFGLRDKLIIFNTDLQRKLFNKSSVTKVIQGQNGWLFLNLDSIVSDFLGMDPPSQQTLEVWANTLEKRGKWLAEQNIHYFVLPVPNKMDIYPEYLPTRYTFFRNKENKTKLDHLFQYLDVHGDFSNIIELKPLFLQEKEEAQLYYRVDSHWNQMGAYLAYLELMKKIQNLYPNVSTVPYSVTQFNENKHKGDLANMMGATTPVEKQRIKERITSCNGEMFKLPNHDSSLTQRHPKVTTCDKAELTAVITYDSFLRYLVPYLAATFKKVTYVSRRDTAWVKGFLEKEKPDVFINERVMRKFGEIVHDDWGLVEEQH